MSSIDIIGYLVAGGVLFMLTLAAKRSPKNEPQQIYTKYDLFEQPHSKTSNHNQENGPSFMKFIGRLFGILAAIGMLLAFIPFLGWLNWLNIPFAILGLIFSVIGKSKGGILLCVAAMLFGLFRLMMGGGLF